MNCEDVSLPLLETDLTSLSEFCVTGISQKIWCEYTLTSLTKCVISRNEGNSQSENPFCTPTSRGLYTDDLQVCRARPPCIKELDGFISDDDDVVSIISISSEDERESSTYSKEPKQELCKPFDLMYPVKANIEQLPEKVINSKEINENSMQDDKSEQWPDLPEGFMEVFDFIEDIYC